MKQNTEPVKVVVTGLGASTPLGGDVLTTWEAMLRGESGIVRLADEKAAELLPPLPVGLARVDPGAALETKQRRRLSRGAQFAIAAAKEAWRDAGLEDAGVPPERVAVVVSAAMGDMTSIIHAWEMLTERGWRRIPPMALPMAMGNAATSAVSMLVGARGGANATVNACSSGTQALATALDMIRRGHADVVVAGGAEAPTHPLVLGAFMSMHAMSLQGENPASACRPFDAAREGLVLGEGAGILVVESEAHARRRGARIYAELAGAGISSDAHHIVQPDPSGSGAAAAVRAALGDAGVRPELVAHVNANGTATLPGDAAEGQAVQAVFGGTGRMPALTANKSMLGHSLGAAGAIESIATVLTVHHGVIPPTLNFGQLDDGLVLDVVHGQARKLDGGGPVVAVKSSAGFGGHNVALTFRTPDAAYA